MRLAGSEGLPRDILLQFRDHIGQVRSVRVGVGQQVIDAVARLGVQVTDGFHCFLIGPVTKHKSRSNTNLDTASF